MASVLNRSSTIVKTGKLLQLKTAPVLLQKQGVGNFLPKRTAVSNSVGAMHPEPVKDPMSLVGFGGTILVGLTLGATISKHVASFLEENDLFVPADDDDDD